MTPEEIENLVAEADRLCDLEHYDEAYLLDLKAAKSGNARAMTHLGWYYENGLGTRQNLGKAFEWYQRSAEQDFAPGCYCLGACYENGIGTDIDLDTARQWYERAADQELEDAVEALIRLRKIAKENVQSIDVHDAERLTDRAQRLFATEQYDEAYAVAIEAAKSGIARAQWLAGESLSRTRRLRAEAIEWLTKAVEQDFAPAYTSLGILLKQDEPERSVELFKKAVALGHPAAQLELAICQFDGTGMPKDRRAAEAVFASYYNMGNEKAGIYYGMAKYHHNNAKEHSEAFRLLNIESVWHTPRSLQMLSECYQYGRGVKADAAKAKACIDRARHLIEPDYEGDDTETEETTDTPQINPEVAANIEEIVGRPMGIFGRMIEALKSKTSTSSQANPENETPPQSARKKAPKVDGPNHDSEAERAYITGIRYMTGVGRRKDLNMAERWLQRAVSMRYDDAKPLLKQIEYARNKGIDPIVPGSLLQKLKSSTTTGAPAVNKQDAKPQAPQNPTYTDRSQRALTADEAYDLGRSYFLGKGRKRDLNEAERYFKIALSKGRENASFFLDKIKQTKGINTPATSDAPDYLIHKAVMGNREAAYELGRHFFFKKDRVQARYWFEKAKNMGETRANFFLKKL